tara:strand:- start:156 stop:572 length:417 start_codon:yes stop_codon:yes gene_type:complete
MSTLKTNTLTGTTSAGSIVVTGEGGSTTTNLQQGLAKNWSLISVSSGTPSTDDSFNTASLTDDSTGNVFVNLTNAMSSVNYSNLLGRQVSAASGTGSNFIQSVRTSNRSTSLYRANNFENGSDADPSHYETQINGDLA